MRKVLLVVIAICFAFSLSSILPAIGQDIDSSILQTTDNDVVLLTSYEMDNLLGSIALYPDPLLAQLLPASTFPDQLFQASQLIQLKGGEKLIDDQDWDVSVKAIAHYPSVINKMVDDPVWSDAVGQAYINQPEDVMKSIQRLRGKAKLLGYLSSNNEQEVIYDSDAIRIVPAQPEYIYVPVYDPQIVYIVGRPHYNTNTVFIVFGSGYSIGSWLNSDCDWHQHRVYYHGWQGNSWIQRSRQHAYVDNHVYINDRYRNNDRIFDRDRIRTDFDRQRQRNYEQRNQVRQRRNLPDSYMPTRPDPKVRIYDDWNRNRNAYKQDSTRPHNNQRIGNDRKETKQPKQINVINTWKTPRTNNDKIVRPNTPNSGNNPRVNDGRQNPNGNIRPNTPNSGNRPRVNDSIQNPNEPVRPNTPNSGNRPRVNDGIQNPNEPVRPNTPNSGNRPRVNDGIQNPNEPVRPNTSNSGNKTRIYEDRQNKNESVRPNISSSENRPRVNENRQNTNNIVRPEIQKQDNNRPEVNNNRRETNENTRINVINSWSNPRVNNDRKSQNETVKSEAPNPANNQKVNNEKKDQDEKVKQEKSSSWGTRRNR